jgi:hypothetical protein
MAFEGTAEMAVFLIAKRADKNAKSKKSETPLDTVEFAKFAEMAGYLRSRGCLSGKEIK